LGKWHLSKSYLGGAIHAVCNELFLHATVDVGHLELYYFPVFFLRDCFCFTRGNKSENDLSCQQLQSFRWLRTTLL